MKTVKKESKKTSVKRVVMAVHPPMSADLTPSMRRVLRLIEIPLPGFDEPAEMRTTIIERLKNATKPIMVPVAPGRYAPAMRSKAQDMCLCYWNDNGDGTKTPFPINQRLVRLDSNVARLLGFAGQYCTLRRLGEAGFIEIIKAAPGFTLINLDSWFNHLRRCAEDPEFWDKEKKNYRIYKDVIV